MVWLGRELQAHPVPTGPPSTRRVGEKRATFPIGNRDRAWNNLEGVPIGPG